jgi:hypothetical protein
VNKRMKNEVTKKERETKSKEKEGDLIREKM